MRDRFLKDWLPLELNQAIKAQLECCQGDKLEVNMLLTLIQEQADKERWKGTRSGKEKKRWIWDKQWMTLNEQADCRTVGNETKSWNGSWFR